MATPERDPGRADEQGRSAAGEPGGGAEGAGSRPFPGAGARPLFVAALVAVLGYAAGSWAGPTAEEATPDQPSLVSEVGGGCAIELPPGHPPIGTMQGLPPGHPPVRAIPRLPAGHPPIPSWPSPALQVPQVRLVTI
jgi:hypothetical protein